MLNKINIKKRAFVLIALKHKILTNKKTCG